MAAISRVLDMNLPERQSAFLWGARKTGKSTYLQTRFPGSIYLDLLKMDVTLDLMRRPHATERIRPGLSAPGIQGGGYAAGMEGRTMTIDMIVVETGR